MKTEGMLEQEGVRGLGRPHTASGLAEQAGLYMLARRMISYIRIETDVLKYLSNSDISEVIL